MSKMTIVQLGVIVLAICLSTQMVSSTGTTAAANTVNSTVNSTTAGTNATTQATDTYSSSANATSPTAGGVSLQAGVFSLLLPVLMATSLLHHYC